VGTGPGNLRAELRFPTTTPKDTLDQAIHFFRQQEPVAAIGIASFGPVDVDATSPTFGYITSTPKSGWPMTDIAGTIGRALGVPIALDTDVNAASLGEHHWGAARGLDTFVYLTVGTGIGGGGLVNGKPIHGLIHPEMGHIRIPHDLARDPFAGCCPFHGDCWEGLAAGPSLEARWGQAGETLPKDHPAWQLEAEYLALGLVNIIGILSPQRIILGGGVMQQGHLFPLIRRRVQALLNNYLRTEMLEEDIDAYIVPPALGDRAGILGALALAHGVTGKNTG
jgi:fructokinase